MPALHLGVEIQSTGPQRYESTSLLVCNKEWEACVLVSEGVATGLEMSPIAYPLPRSRMSRAESGRTRLMLRLKPLVIRFLLFFDAKVEHVVVTRRDGLAISLNIKARQIGCHD